MHMANKDVDIRRKDSSPGRSTMMSDFENIIESFFGTRFNSLLGDLPVMSRRALTNIQEIDQGYLLSAEIPGIPQENIEVSVNGNLLTIRAEQKQEATSEASKGTLQRSHRSFYESIALPTNINPEEIEANYENGILEVLLPKTEQSQPKRVEIKLGREASRLGMPEQSQSSSSQKGSQH